MALGGARHVLNWQYKGFDTWNYDVCMHDFCKQFIFYYDSGKYSTQSKIQNVIATCKNFYFQGWYKKLFHFNKSSQLLH